MYFQMDKPHSYVEVSVACAQLGIEDFRDEIYREEMAVLKETVAVMRKQLKNERKRADRAVYGKEKLHDVRASTTDKAQEYYSKIIEMRNIIERQRELAVIMFKKHVTNHGEEIKMKLIKTFGKKQKILAGESFENVKLNATEKDSGVCIPCSNCSTSTRNTSRMESKSDDVDIFLKASVSELEKENLELNEKIAKLQNEYDSLHEKHTVKNITYDAILNGIEECVNEDKERFEMGLEDMKKRADLNEERYKMVKMHVRDKDDLLKKMNENQRKLLEELEVSKEEFGKEKNMLEKLNAVAAKELIEERRLKEEEAAAKEECVKQIVKLIAEKSQFVISNEKLMMKKNMLSLDYEKVKEDLKNQGKILEKAQEYARDLEEEKYMKRLNERKGWRKLRFWK